MASTKWVSAAAGLGALIGITDSASAKQWQVTMVNQSSDGAMSFSPGFLRIAPGDQIRFIAKDKSHNAESLSGLTPAGGSSFRGAMNEDVTVRFTVPGLYGYKCLPHFGMGMVGLVQVGKPVNKLAARAVLDALPPLPRGRMSKYLAQVR